MTLGYAYLPRKDIKQNNLFQIYKNLTYFVIGFHFLKRLGQSLSNATPWSYHIGWIYNYICNQCLSPLKLWVRISIRAEDTYTWPHHFTIRREMVSIKLFEPRHFLLKCLYTKPGEWAVIWCIDFLCFYNFPTPDFGPVPTVWYFVFLIYDLTLNYTCI